MLASVPLMLEYEAVLNRSEHVAAFGITPQEVNEVLDAVAARVEPVAFRFHWRPQLNDQDDEMVLETAVNGQADRLVTFNLRDLASAAELFGIRAERPAAVWRELCGGIL